MKTVDIEVIKELLYALAKDLEQMEASYKSHVHAKQSIERLWKSIESKCVNSGDENRAANSADATSL